MLRESERLLPLAEVLEATGLSRSTIYSEMRKGRFPVARKIGLKSVRWRASEIDEWIAGLPAARGDLGKKAMGEEP